VKTDETGCEEIQKIVEESDNVDVIVIDEINFFSENIITLVEDLAQKDYRVILSGLDQTFRGEPFNPVPQLLSIADHIEKRQAVCEICGEPATKTQRLMDEKPAPYDSPTIDVGGEEKYEPRCRQCHDVPKS
jgi:thymidine kinase